MLIPQQFSYGPASVVSSGNQIANHPQSVNGIRHSTTGSSAVRAAVYPSVDGRMFATKMQSDIPGFNMYAAAAAAAAATGQTGPSALNSSASYAAAAAAAASAPSHGIVPSHYNAPAIEHSPYYSPLGSGYDMKNGEMWTAGDYGQPSPAYYQYDSGFTPQYPYDRYCGMDMNDGVRRKNATRESTNTLKAWLQEHKKNPYPTKGEKIMLAIITKMTLTQVSTWFANARRRLKKENKMTWVPKNRANESGSGAEDRRISDDKDIDEKSEDGDCKSEIGENEQTINPSSSEVESEAKPVYPSYPQEEGQKTLSYCQESDPGIESQNTSDKSQIKPGFPTHILPPNGMNALPNAADLTASTQPRYDGMNDSQHRSIWSPIDNTRPPDLVGQQLMNRPYHQGYGTTSYYHGMYQQDMETEMHDRRTGINHQSPYLRHPSSIDIQNMGPHQTPMPPSSQQYPPPTRRIPSCNNSYTGENQDKTKPIPDPLGQEATRRSECRFSSPVTSLQNWVNGVFQAPRSTMSGGSPNSVVGDKTKPLNENADHAISPQNDCSRYHERGNYGQHRYVQPNPTNSMGTISNSSDSNNNDPYAVDHYPPEMISNSSYSSCGYYGEKSHTDVMRSYSYDTISGQQQQSSHTVPYYSNPINIRLRNTSEIPGPSKTISTTVAVTKTVPTGSPNHQDAVPCHDSALEQQTKVENNQSLMMYSGNSLTSHTTLVTPRVTVPLLPQYSNPCQYSLNSSQSGHYVRNQSHSDFLALPKPGNQVVAQSVQESVSNASNLAHGVLSPSVDSSGNLGTESSTMECKVSPRNEIQAAEALTNLSTR